MGKKNHSHHGGHHHHHSAENISGSKMLFSVILNFIITIAEIIGGLLSNSLSLLSDALHNFSDTISILMSYIAHKIGQRSPDSDKTFGYKRIEILAALFNAVAMVAIILLLIKEAITRFMEPAEIKSEIMIIVASIGLVANLISVILLHHDSKKNLNVKSAYLHLLGDTLSSVAVIIGGILIKFFSIYWLDPVITILVALYLIKETFSILKETTNILMQSAPHDFDYQNLEKELLAKFPEIKNIHHQHVWQLTDNMVFYEAHLGFCQNLDLQNTDKIRCSVEKYLKENFAIKHVTLQCEYNYDHSHYIQGEKKE